MKRRLSRGGFALSCAAFGASARTALPARAADAYTLRLNLPTAANSIAGIAAVRLATAVERRSNGQLKIELYPSLQLATEVDAVQALASGVIDLSIENSTFFESVAPRLQLLDLPFLFKDLNSAFRVLDGPIGSELFAELESKGIVGLGWGSPGFKELETTSKAVTVPDDMKGLRIRTLNGAVYVATYQALGAVPVVINYNEAFTALQQHVVDGVEINLDALITQKFYTIVKYAAMTNHIISAQPIMGSKRKLEALPSALQTILKEEAKAFVPYWRSLAVHGIADNIQFLKKNGVSFTEIKYREFRKAVEPVYAMVASKIGSDLVDRTSAAANAALGK